MNTSSLPHIFVECVVLLAVWTPDTETMQSCTTITPHIYSTLYIIMTASRTLRRHRHTCPALGLRSSSLVVFLSAYDRLYSSGLNSSSDQHEHIINTSSSHGRRCIDYGRTYYYVTHKTYPPFQHSIAFQSCCHFRRSK